MMTNRCPNRVGLQAAAFAGLLVVTAAPAPSQEPGAHSFDGEWSLVWDVATAPGGATIAFGGGILSPYNTAFYAAKKQFQVREDGTIEWSQSEAGSMSHDGTYTAGGVSSGIGGGRKIHLRATGKALAPRAAYGELRAEDRRLSLDLSVISGSGYSSGSTPGAYATIIANLDDREQVIIPILGGTHRAPNPPWIVKWQDLKPTRVTKDELAPDVIQETITWEATRETRIPKEINGELTPPMTERLEIRHVRYLNLVPRG